MLRFRKPGYLGIPSCCPAFCQKSSPPNRSSRVFFVDCLLPKKKGTLPKTNIAPENGWLPGRCDVSFRECNNIIENLSLSSNIPSISGYAAGWFTPLANLIQGHLPRLGNRLGFVEESRSQELQQEGFFFGKKKNMTKTLLKNGISA